MYQIAQYLLLIPDDSLNEEEQNRWLKENDGRYGDVDYLSEMIASFFKFRKVPKFFNLNIIIRKQEGRTIFHKVNLIEKK